MPRQVSVSLENNFVGGLKTEFTGLNFPENSCTDVDNCVFSRSGEVSRRLGLDYEEDFAQFETSNFQTASSSYKWTNVGGDGNKQFLVRQNGDSILFYDVSAATEGNPISANRVTGLLSLNFFKDPSNLEDPSQIPCTYTDGNGYLFIFNPAAGPLCCSYAGGTVNAITVDILTRDFLGAVDGLEDDERPATLSTAHEYNLRNQGWPSANITQWNSDVTGFPSNSDIWWSFKNSSGVFDPATTLDNISFGGKATGGSFVLFTFDQDRNVPISSAGLTVVSTMKRPRVGTWFQGRIWYSGVDASVEDSGTAFAYNWSEDIYFSQIIENKSQFGKCYQVNDPTAEDRFDLLPSDGGVIKIQGCGTINKLFPIINGLLVFATNGVWFITGSQGIGFTANDYTVTKISSIPSISSHSFVSVQGMPVWWNEEGIYLVEAGQSLTVKSATDTTIASFFKEIPSVSKRFATGDYDPLNQTIQWCYRSTKEFSLFVRQSYDRILCLNTGTGAFYPYTIAEPLDDEFDLFSETPVVNGVIYIDPPSSSVSVPPKFRYLATAYSGSFSHLLTFAEERDENYVDWASADVDANYDSYFITGYKLKGGALRKFQPTYVYVFSTNDTDTAYKIQGIWNYANSGNSGKFSSVQLANVAKDNFDKLYKRHKIRGVGLALQLKIQSVDGKPFNIFGWSMWETSHQSP